jgi:hypothetical protein
MTLALVCHACSSERSSDATSFQARDSLGIRIVANSEIKEDQLSRWTLSAEPILDVGTVEEPEEYQLFRAIDAILFEDGHVVVVNAGTSELRIFDSDGVFQRSFGGPGEGPGEFRVPFAVYHVGRDSLAVWDPQLRRLSIFTTAGQFVRHVRPALPAANPQVRGVFAGGSFLVTDERFTIPESGFEESQLTLVLYAPDGSFRDSAGVHPMGTFGRLGDVGMVGSPTFSSGTFVTTSADAYYVATSRDYEMAVHAPSGQLLQLVRWIGPDRTVSQADIDAHWDERLSGTSGNGRRRVEQMRQATPAADRFPAYGGLEVDREGNVWVKEYRRPRTRGQDTWWVFDREGRMIAYADLPVGLRVTDIGPDYVLGIELDSLDVEHVRMYAVTK